MARHHPLHLLNAAIFLLALAPATSPSPYTYGGGNGAPNQQQQQGAGGSYGHYGQFYGSPGDGGTGGRRSASSQLEYRVDTETGRHRGGATSGGRLTALEQQRQQQKKLNVGTFRDADHCQEKCEFDCQYALFFAGRNNEAEELFYCAKLRPPPRALHQKMIDRLSGAGIFEFIVCGIVAFSILICCICSCYQCCCKGRTYGRRRGGGAANYEDVPNGNDGGAAKGVGQHSLNGGGTLSTSGLSPEHESLTNTSIQHIDDGGIHAAPLPDKRFGGGLNGAIHHHGTQPQHHFPRSNTNGGNGFTGIRTHSDV